MKRRLILLLLFSVFFLANSSVNGETEDSETSTDDIITRMRNRLREAEERRAAKLDDKEAVVRIYDNWREDRAEFKQISAQFSGDEIIFDFNDIDESAFVVMLADDQFDEELRGMLSRGIYAEFYKQGLPLRFK